MVCSFVFLLPEKVFPHFRVQLKRHLLWEDVCLYNPCNQTWLRAFSKYSYSSCAYSCEHPYLISAYLHTCLASRSREQTNQGRSWVFSPFVPCDTTSETSVPLETNWWEIFQVDLSISTWSSTSQAFSNQSIRHHKEKDGQFVHLKLRMQFSTRMEDQRSTYSLHPSIEGHPPR